MLPEISAASEATAEQQESSQNPQAVIVCSIAGVTALRATDGAPLWMHQFPLRMFRSGWPNLVSDGGVIFVGVAARARGAAERAARVIALSARDGAALWQTDLLELEGPPALAVEGERVVALGIVGDRAAVALDAETGAVHWMRPNLRSWRSRLHAGWSAVIHWAALSEYFDVPQERGSYEPTVLAVEHGTVYVGPIGSSSLHALDARSGAERWRSALRGVSTQVAAGAAQVATATITPRGYMVAVLRATDGATLHTLRIERENERPLLLSEQGVAYLMRGAELRAVRVSDGSLEWRNDRILDEASSPSDTALKVCLTDQTLFYQWGQSVPPRLTVGALDHETGKQRWEWSGDEAQARTAAKLASGDGQLYVATNHGLLAFREHDGRLLWRSLPETDLSVVQPALASSAPV